MADGLRKVSMWDFKNMFLFIVSLILVILFSTSTASSDEKILHSKIVSIQPEKTDGQYCFIKVIIKQKVILLLKKKFWSVLMVKKA